MDGKTGKMLRGWREEGIGRRSDEKVEGRGGKRRGKKREMRGNEKGRGKEGVLNRRKK